MTRVFLDTGYVIALESRDDQHHEVATTHWRQFAPEITSIVTTTCVVGELLTFFNNRNQHAKAVEIGQRIMSSSLTELVHVDEALFDAGWRYFQRHSDKRYSLTDCVSFLVMDQLDIQYALAFDRHFLQAGYHRLP